MKSTWILVANNVHARIFTAETANSDLIEIEGFSHMEGRLHDREMTTDLPGKIKSSDGSGHAYEQATDPKKHEAENFAHMMAHHLEASHNDNKFEQLLIIAEPSFLGLLRNNLSESIKKHIVFELDKNITTHNVSEIRKHLPDFLPNL